MGPWGIGIVLVKKKDGSKRLCIDYLGLNDVTIKDPRMDESLDQLAGSRWFSFLDINAGYWQIGLEHIRWRAIANPHALEDI